MTTTAADTLTDEEWEMCLRLENMNGAADHLAALSARVAEWSGRTRGLNQ